MEENPYNPPRAGIGPADRVSARADLKQVATSQKYLLICILIYLVLVGVSFGLPAEQKGIVAIALLVLIVVEAVFAFQLALKVYGTGLGIVMGIGTLIPCAGLLALLLISSKATAILREGGHKVGLLGADLSKF